jgi:translation initiation factor IF-2
MSEEPESKQKPKATLIKHRRPEAEAESKDEHQKTEKKKVVVVKKKPVVKKPAPHRVIAKASPKADERPEVEAPSMPSVETPPPRLAPSPTLSRANEEPRSERAPEAPLCGCHQGAGPFAAEPSSQG